jgi:uncharacterized membrane protein
MSDVSGVLISYKRRRIECSAINSFIEIFDTDIIRGLISESAYFDSQKSIATFEILVIIESTEEFNLKV